MDLGMTWESNYNIRQAEKTSKELADKLAQSKDELAKSLATNQAAQTQFKVALVINQNNQMQHKLKRVNAEIATLKEKVQKGSFDAKSKIKLLNPLRTPPITAQQRKDEQLYNVVIAAKDERERELISENQNLRRALFEFYDTCRTEPADNVEAQLKLPLSMCWKPVYTKYTSLFKLLRQQYPEKLRKSSHASQEQLIEKDEFKRIIERQNTLLEESIFENMKPALPEDEDDQERISQELKSKQDLLEKRALQLEMERKKFTEAAIKLGIERSNILVYLMRERQALEAEKTSLETQKLLTGMDLPETPKFMKRTVDKGNRTPLSAKQAQDEIKDESPLLKQSDILRETETFSVSPGSYLSNGRSPIATKSPNVIKSALRKRGEKPTTYKSAKVTLNLTPGGGDKENYAFDWLRD
ncbi:hypothetical protein HDU96_010633 [Phlyctochytrium bullatum]|nr:hypothetical protein HDU96_010633 [Phlyctochytrium bullatum]